MERQNSNLYTLFTKVKEPFQKLFFCSSFTIILAWDLNIPTHQAMKLYLLPTFASDLFKITRNYVFPTYVLEFIKITMFVARLPDLVLEWCWGRFWARLCMPFGLWCLNYVSLLKKPDRLFDIQNLVVFRVLYGLFCSPPNNPYNKFWTNLVFFTHTLYMKSRGCQPIHGWCIIYHREKAP